MVHIQTYIYIHIQVHTCGSGEWEEVKFLTAQVLPASYPFVKAVVTRLLVVPIRMSADVSPFLHPWLFHFGVSISGRTQCDCRMKSKLVHRYVVHTGTSNVCAVQPACFVRPLVWGWDAESCTLQPCPISKVGIAHT